MSKTTATTSPVNSTPYHTTIQSPTTYFFPTHVAYKYLRFIICHSAFVRRNSRIGGKSEAGFS